MPAWRPASTTRSRGSPACWRSRSSASCSAARFDARVRPRLDRLALSAPAREGIDRELRKIAGADLTQVASCRRGSVARSDDHRRGLRVRVPPRDDRRGGAGACRRGCRERDSARRRRPRGRFIRGLLTLQEQINEKCGARRAPQKARGDGRHPRISRIMGFSEQPTLRPADLLGPNVRRRGEAARVERRTTRIASHPKTGLAIPRRSSLTLSGHFAAGRRTFRASIPSSAQSADTVLNGVDQRYVSADCRWTKSIFAAPGGSGSG